MAYRLGMRALRRFARDKAEGDEVVSRLKSRLSEMHLRAPRRPLKGDKPLNPQLPCDLTLLNEVQLGRLLSEFAAMAQYAQFQVAITSVEHAIAKRVDRVTRARVRLEKTGTVDDKSAKVEVDSRTSEASLRLLEKEGAERLTMALLEGFVIGRETCSREITRRSNLVYDSSPR